VELKIEIQWNHLAPLVSGFASELSQESSIRIRTADEPIRHHQHFALLSFTFSQTFDLK
jgi:hypothetical protein